MINSVMPVACTKTGSKNDLFLNCRRKPKELSKKELLNVAPASEDMRHSPMIKNNVWRGQGFRSKKRMKFYRTRKLNNTRIKQKLKKTVSNKHKFIQIFSFSIFTIHFTNENLLLQRL
jgi:hypothetical protein